MRVLVHTLPEIGHVNPTLPLARALQQRGHDVRYTTVIDLDPHIVRCGFETTLLHRATVPLGTLPAIDRIDSEGERRAATVKMTIDILDDYLRGDIEATVRTLAPDVILVDVIAPEMAFVAHRLQIPCLRLSTSLSQVLDELPPLTSRLTPSSSLLTLATARAQGSCVAHAHGVGIADKFQLLALRFGYPPEHISLETVFTPAPTLYPEIILCPSAFDFPRSRPGGSQYIATPVDIERRETVPQSLADFAEGGPFIYASLGSQSGRYPHAVSFFRAFLDALAAKPEWRAVLVTGKKLARDPMFTSLPRNVFAVDAAPQLWCLARASAFVTHAGLGGIREAIRFGVPMITIPQQYDQPGNAARVVHHGIGDLIEPFAISRDAITAALATILAQHDVYVARVRELDRKCQTEEKASVGVELVEGAVSTSIESGDRGRSPASASPAERQVSDDVEDVRRGFLFLDADGIVAGTKSVEGSFVTDDRPPPLALAKAGFPVYPELGHALDRATGSYFTRAELRGPFALDDGAVLGRSLRRGRLTDVSRIFWDFAEWCVAVALEDEKKRSPSLVAAMCEGVRRHRVLVEAGDLHAAQEIGDRLIVLAYPVWERGYNVAGSAIAPPEAIAAARLARLAAIYHFGRVAAGRGTGTSESRERFERGMAEATKRFDDELTRRVLAYVDAQPELS